MRFVFSKPREKSKAGLAVGEISVTFDWTGAIGATYSERPNALRVAAAVAARASVRARSSNLDESMVPAMRGVRVPVSIRHAH
ncbi:hypothetical protein VI08_20305 [Luteibacter yeojuensis]|uniref:Uncharacterized protein n=1 Tax=Luteibacter yeojuensis TaxID=345309 RepID=A0A0F3K179_9GAMM|nr:hypothetical protein VI08_20305 [Luteibacter yeojuensis]